MLNQGSVAQIGHPLELYHHPVNEFVAGFIGSPQMNFLPGELVTGSAESASLRLAGAREIVARVNAVAAQVGKGGKWAFARSIYGFVKWRTRS